MRRRRRLRLVALLARELRRPRNLRLGCRCGPGWSGETCGEGVECRSGSAPAHGVVTFSNNSKFPSIATYACSEGFEIAAGAVSTRVCGPSGAWDGARPGCVDLDDCASNPCAHGACSDVGAVSFSCACDHGWGGDACDQELSLALDPCAARPCAPALRTRRSRAPTAAPATPGTRAPTATRAWRARRRPRRSRFGSVQQRAAVPQRRDRRDAA